MDATPYLLVQLSDTHITHPGRLISGRVDTAAALRVFDGVVEKVEEDLVQPRRIRSHRRKLGGNLNADGHTSFLRETLQFAGGDLGAGFFRGVEPEEIEDHWTFPLGRPQVAGLTNVGRP